MMRRSRIRLLAKRLIERLDPPKIPVDVGAIARSLGAEVRLQRADETLSGFLLRDAVRGRTIIGVNAEQHPNRRRFTIAHEIGHLLLHEGAAIRIDSTQNVFRLSLRNVASSTGEVLEEREANLFAAELLLPSDLVARELARHVNLDLHDEDDVRALADRFEVSAQALSIRLAYLGYSHA